MALTDDRGPAPEMSNGGGNPGFDKQPPQDLPAEQSVLGGMMLSKDAIADVVPSTGHLQEDASAMLRTVVERIEAVGVDVMTGLLSELDELPESLVTTVPEVFGRIVERARERGEV
ncbi:hypothetical protein ACFQ1S_34970, partial [Kibdelosporangium lantanae]